MTDEEKNKEDTKKDELETIRKERDEYLNGWKRARADFINYKKDEEERLRSALEFEKAMFAGELIHVLQNLQLGLRAWRGESPEKTGMELIKNHVEDMVKRYGIEQMKSEIGKPFNPETSECIEIIEKQGAASGVVVEEVEAGYAIGGKVIKPAKVKVAK